MPESRFSVVIATRDRADVLADCLSSLAAQTRPPTRIVIADSSQDDATRGMTERFPSFDGGELVYHRCACTGASAQRNEALYVGRPVVATDSGGPRDVIGPGDGQLVPVGNSAAMSEAIVDLLGRYDEYDQTAIAASARRRFGYAAFAQTMLSCYDEISRSYSRAVELAACGKGLCGERRWTM